METGSVNRFSPLQWPHGWTSRNRVVVPPMASQTASREGYVTSSTLDHYRRLGEAGAGLLIVEYSFVHPSGRSEEFQLGVDQDRKVDGLAALARLIRSSGALAGIQLTHAGGKTEKGLTGGVLMGPSDVAVPLKDRVLERPSPMSSAEIELWKSSFVAAADRAASAGFDLIELHSAHGYGLNQWISSITNRRSDAYGGDLRGRLKILLEIARTIRDRYPRLLLSVRMPGQDFIADGLRVDDTLLIAQALENAGVDVLNISSGIGGWRRPSDRIGEGYLVAEAERIQAAVQIPVIGVGGIEGGSFIDEGLRLKRFSLAAVGRAILKDPAAWRRNNLSPSAQSRIDSSVRKA